MEQVLPIIVSTWEALEGVASQNCPVIYVEEGLYRAQSARIGALMADHHYVLSIRRGKKGVFFLLTAGENRFDHSRHQIRDPSAIL